MWEFAVKVLCICWALLEKLKRDFFYYNLSICIVCVYVCASV